MTDFKNPKPPSIPTFVVPGDVLSTTAPMLRQQLSELLDHHTGSDLEIDLSAAGMIDSVGLNLLVWVWKTLKSRNGTLRVRTSNPNIERLLRFTRLSSYVEVIGPDRAH